MSQESIERKILVNATSSGQGTRESLENPVLSLKHEGREIVIAGWKRLSEAVEKAKLLGSRRRQTAIWSPRCDDCHYEKIFKNFHQCPTV